MIFLAVNIHCLVVSTAAIYTKILFTRGLDTFSYPTIIFRHLFLCFWLGNILNIMFRNVLYSEFISWLCNTHFQFSLFRYVIHGSL
jgi:hypothetical protein